jgi:hypothetical protein
MFPNQKKKKKIPLPTLQFTQFPFQSEVQIQKTSLKKKKERKCLLVTFPNQKKNFPPFNSPIPESSIQEAEIQSLGNVPKEKKKKGNVSNVPKSKK